MTHRHILLEERMSGPLCPRCHVQHSRLHQASQYRPNRLMLALAVIGEIIGATFVLLLLFGAIAYGGPVIAEWLGMGTP